MALTSKWSLMFEQSDTILRVDMNPGDSMTAESGAMLAMSPSLSLRGDVESALATANLHGNAPQTIIAVGHAKGGTKKAFSRMFLGGESFFQTTITCESAPGHILLAPKAPGNIHVIDVQAGEDWNLASGAFLAAEETIESGSERQKVGGGLFSGAGFFIMHATGHGKLAVNSYGTMHEVTLGDGEEYIVDNNHLVAWTATYTVEKASSGI